jgi:hypothetical protein
MKWEVMRELQIPQSTEFKYQYGRYTVFRDLTSCCNLVEDNQLFGETYNLHLQGQRVNQSCAYCLLLAGFMLGLLFDPEDGGTTFHQSVGGLLPDYTALHPRR